MTTRIHAGVARVVGIARQANLAAGLGLAALMLVAAPAGPGHAQSADPASAGAPADAPWLDRTRPLDERARLLAAALTLDEKFSLVHGHFAVGLPGAGGSRPEGALGSAGFVPGIARLGIPPLQETDGPLGVVNPGGLARPGDTAVALPSGVALAATFDPDRAYADGAVLGREAAARGFNVVLGGGVNLARDPRGGRNFEYAGEDPLLAGMMVGAAVRGTQDQHVISTVKHYAINDQETDRTTYNVEMDDAARHESDLLAFEIAIEQGHPGAVMCAYNKVGGLYACENPKLLSAVLKQDWGFAGWVMSDWGAVHSAAAAMNAGLDQESGQELDSQVFFDAPLRAALARGAAAQAPSAVPPVLGANGTPAARQAFAPAARQAFAPAAGQAFVPPALLLNAVQPARLDDAVRRILRGVLAAGLMDHWTRPAADMTADAQVARQTADEAIVLLSNPRHMLPIEHIVHHRLPPQFQCVAVIGGESDAGVAAGGGSSQVTPLGGFARQRALGGGGIDAFFRNAGFDPPSPLSRIIAHAEGARVIWIDGRYPSEAAAKARLCNAVFVFATQWSGENSDIPDLSLPDGQDAMIDAVTKANPNTVVVLQTAGPVRMPWLKQAAAVLEAWYPGSGGADAIADVLFGAVNPSGHLPQTFPASEQDLPTPDLPGFTNAPGVPVTLRYHEGDKVGYRWFNDTGKTPLFPFGFGLSYTDFAYANLRVTGGTALHAEFDIRNTGGRAGVAVPQLYLTRRGPGKSQRLLGWRRVMLQPGASAHIVLDADPRLLGVYVPPTRQWLVAPLPMQVGVGPDAGDIRLTAAVSMGFVTVKP